MTEPHPAALKAAQFLMPLAEVYRRQDSTKAEQDYLFKVAKWAVREFDPFFLPLNVSNAAALESAAITEDLRAIPWKKKHEIRKNQQKAFHYEHIIEVAALAREVVQAKNIDQIVATLAGIKVSWITMEEHDGLKAEDKKRRASGGPTLRDSASWDVTCRSAGIAFRYDW